MGLQRDRLPAGAAALLAVFLAAPSVLVPTWHLTTLDSQGGVVLFDQQLWSWGRSRVLGAGGAVVQDLWDPFGLVVLVALLGLATAAVVAWLLVRAAWVPVVAPLAWAALLGHLVSSTAQRHGRPVRDDVHGLAASGSSTLAGWLESGAALALAVAVALLVLSLTGVRMPSAWGARARALLGWDPAGGPAPGAVATQLPVAAPGPEPVTERAVAGPSVRVAGATLGGTGVLLAAASAVWPTTIIAVRAPGVGDVTKGYEQRIWSWGRQAVYSSDGALLDAYGGPDPVARLVLLVVVLACAGAGLAWWVLRPKPRGELLVAAGTALAFAAVAGLLVERLSFDERSIGLQPGQVHVTTVAGWLEVAAVAVLALALALVVATAAPGPAATVARTLSVVRARLAQLARRARRRPVEVARTGTAAGRSATGRVWTVRDAAPPGTTHTTSVGFSDDEGERERG